MEKFYRLLTNKLFIHRLSIEPYWNPKIRRTKMGTEEKRPDINEIKTKFYEFQRQHSETSNIHVRFQARQNMIDTLMTAFKSFPHDEMVLRWVSRNM